MKADPENRIGSAPGRGAGRFWLLACVVASSATVGVLMIPSWRDFALWTFHWAEQSVGVAPAQSPFSTLYEKFGVEGLPVRAFASEEVGANLARLSRDSCDRPAMAALDRALVAAGETRLSAEMLFGFARSCANAEGEGYRAGDLFLQLGDVEKTLAAADDLLRKDSTNPSFHYLRGKALAAAGRNSEAVAEYKSTIELTQNQRGIGEWVFTELANLFSTLGRPCDAAQTILEWVAIEPQVRRTARALKLIRDYSAGGCRGNAAAPAAKDL